jgi:transposase-like protein
MVEQAASSGTSVTKAASSFGFSPGAYRKWRQTRMAAAEKGIDLADPIYQKVPVGMKGLQSILDGTYVSSGGP